MSQKTKKKEKVVILGGGLGGIGTALQLSDPKNPKAHNYDITVYQLGWRLGGKGASGRNLDSGLGFRIEEHGLHVWMGFYDNAFRMIRDVLEEWDIRDGHPWHTRDRRKRWLEAFTPAYYAPLVEPTADGKWDVWNLCFPKLPDAPGDGSEPRDDLFDFLESLLAWIEMFIDMLDRDDPPDQCLREWFANPELDDNACGRLSRRKRHKKLKPSAFLSTLSTLRRLMFRQIGMQGIGGWRRRYERCGKHKREQATILRIALDLSAALFSGLLWNAWSIYRGDLDVLDDYDFREFLKKYGAETESVESPFIDSLYDGVFATIGGRGRSTEDLAAGVAIRSLINILVSYKGAPFWRMSAGMGDTIFAPAYEVLKKRGVRFKFFHRVSDISPSVDNSRIETITIGRQANIIDPDTKKRVDDSEYDPLIDVPVRDKNDRPFPKPLKCWPDRPLYSQLQEGDQLESLAKDTLETTLETQWKDVEKFDLRAGEDFDFDHVVMAIPIGAFEAVCPKLLEANWNIKMMCEKVLTVRTAAYQVWLKNELGELGWDRDPPIFGNFRDPLNTWADMTHLIPAEGSQKKGEPKNIAYFVGPMPDSVTNGVNYVQDEASTLLDEMAKFFWTDARDKQGNFNGDLLISDYSRANIDSSARYVLSVAGSTRYRLGASESGFSNLTFAGDWTRNGFNVGAVEPTVMSAMQASNAISGYPLLSDIIRNDGP